MSGLCNSQDMIIARPLSAGVKEDNEIRKLSLCELPLAYDDLNNALIKMHVCTLVTHVHMLCISIIKYTYMCIFAGRQPLKLEQM